MKNLILILSFVILNSQLVIAKGLSGQALIDSLEAELPKAKGDTNHVNQLFQLSNEYANYDIDKRIKYCEDALKLSRSISWSKGLASSLYKLSWAHIRNADYSQAVDYADELLKIREKEKNYEGIAIANNILGNINYYQSNYPLALKYFLKMLDYAEKDKNKQLIALSYNNIANVFGSQKDYDKALEYHLKALEIRRILGNKKQLAMSIENIGVVYTNQNKFEEALENFQEALLLTKELDSKRSIAQAMSNIGEVKFLMGLYEEAVEYLTDAVKINKQIGNKLNLANSYGALGNFYLNLSIDSLDQTNKLNRKNSKLNHQNYLEESIKYFLLAEKIYSQINELKFRSQTLHKLSEVYELFGNYEKSIYFLRKHIIIKDSAFNLKRQNQINNLVNEKDRIEKEKEIELLKQSEKAEKEKSEMITYSASGGIGLVGIFAFLIYRRFRKEKKLSNELDKQKNAVEEANIELETQQKQLEEIHYELVEKNEEVLSSIRYAETIQSAMLPWASTLKESIKNYFVIFKPKDIVSGDFYWFKKLEKGYLIAVADCTGHGVPGSMISMMGSSILDEAVLSQKLENTGDILSYLNSKMIESLNKQEEENQSRDGMDICIIRVNSESLDDSKSSDECAVQFSGAKRPIYYLENGELKTIKGDRNSIAGEKHLDSDYEFTTNDLTLEKGTKIYLTSDGYVDQMGTNGKKFGTKRFKEIITEDLPINNIHQKLESEFTSHIGKEEQRDDVTVIGLEL